MIIEEIIIHSEREDIPKEYCYDTETPDFYVYRHKYTGKEIHIVKNPKTYINVQNYINKVLDKIRAEIIDEKDFAYADFDRYKEEVLGVEPDELPDDDFRFGMERAIEIIDKYKAESEG